MANEGQIEIQLPTEPWSKDTTLTRFTHEGKDYALFVSIKQDIDPASTPDDHADENAFLVYGHRDFTVNGPKGEKALEVHENMAEWEKTHHVWPVYAYIHSGVRLQLNTDAGMPDRQWDVSMAGYCLVTRDTSDIPNALQYAEGMIEEWNQSLSGDVWGYDVALYDLQRDAQGDPIEERDYYEGHGKALSEDSCWGFYGLKYAQDEAKQSAENDIDGLTKIAA